MDFSTGSEVPSDDVSTTTAASTKTVHAPRFDVKTDAQRDDLLTEFGKETLRDRYLLPGESYQDLFARVAAAYADDEAHAQRVYDYISKLWFMPATPVLSNGGTGRGLPISCYLNSVDDSLEGIVGVGGRDAGKQVLVALAREQVAVAKSLLAELGQQFIALGVGADIEARRMDRLRAGGDRRYVVALYF